MELSFFSFRMQVALSAMTTIWKACTTSARPISSGVNPYLASSGRMTPSLPTRNRKSPGKASRASRAPSNVAWGAWSPPMTSSAMRWPSTRRSLGGLCDADGQLAAVEAATGADAVRQLGGLAIGAGAGAHDFERVVGAPAVAAGLG